MNETIQKYYTAKNLVDKIVVHGEKKGTVDNIFPARMPLMYHPIGMLKTSGAIVFLHKSITPLTGFLTNRPVSI
jgi:hypothetical protein